MNEDNCNVVGRILNCAGEESALTDGKPDAAKMKPICYDPCAHVYRVMGEAGRQGVFVRQGDRSLSRVWEKFENWESMKPETIPMTMAIRALKAALPEMERVSIAI